MSILNPKDDAAALSKAADQVLDTAQQKVEATADRELPLLEAMARRLLDGLVTKLAAEADGFSISVHCTFEVHRKS
ncbi:MAG: hypothetical protein U0Q18_37050 [Bryobacteraceae bacterium]